MMIGCDHVSEELSVKQALYPATEFMFVEYSNFNLQFCWVGNTDLFWALASVCGTIVWSYESLVRAVVLVGQNGRAKW
jgi:hypothetical protein